MTKKRILITGKDSYIGDSFINWLEKSEGEYEVHSIDMRGDDWKQHDFSDYDVVFHVAGIAHIKETKQNRELYFKVNRDLAFETAKKAKIEGVRQFIFLSSMSVYGMETGVITRDTIPKPKSAYGISKYEAEKKIAPLEDSNFKVAILRPPMVYGKGCKGNYQTLSKFAKISPIFPDFKNERSMIYIDNLSEFVRLIIEKKEEGLFFPQNNEYVCTTEMVEAIAIANEIQIKLTKLLNPLLYITRFAPLIKKVFGDLYYHQDTKCNKFSKGFNNLYESVVLTEGDYN